MKTKNSDGGVIREERSSFGKGRKKFRPDLL